MDKVKQADLQYQDALDQIAYYREELKKRDSRIHELETLGKTFLDASTAQAARIHELEQALRQAQSLLRSSQSNWNEQAYFDADTVIANALK